MARSHLSAPQHANGTHPIGNGRPTSTMNIESLGPQDGSPEPIAVVGMAFRFPQDATTEDGFWDMLVNKRNAMTEFPKDRVNVDAFYHPDHTRPDAMSFRGGHFLKDFPDRFDAPFFSLSAAEAEATDPVHRIVLETTYHALESAGITIDEISSSRTSVYASAASDDYRLLSARNVQQFPAYHSPGNGPNMISNRLSWFFNLTGPSITVDTACSGSLTAFDMACQGLRNGNADMAIVVGGNLMLDVNSCLDLSRLNFCSPDSRSYSFDSRANGYGRGEGIGVVVLKRLTTALHSNDTIRSIVRATGSNQDGRTPGITQPNPAAQEQLIRETYERANLNMSLTRYVEAHGTGTAVGDPIEARAIGNAFKQYRSAAAPMLIASVKSNVGHLENASGMAGLIKTILLLEKGVIVPNADFQELNPRIDAQALGIHCCANSIPWPTSGLRRASVSSFGFGGSNCHVILDDVHNFLELHGLQGNHRTVPEPPRPDSLSNGDGTTGTSIININGAGTTKASESRTEIKKLLVFSTADRDGIARIAHAYSTLADTTSLHTETERLDHLTNLAYTLSERRSLFSWRSFAIVEDIADLQHLQNRISKPINRLTDGRLGFIFTGQGAQYAGMAHELFRFPVFEASMLKSETYIKQLGSSWSLSEELRKTGISSRINEPELSQPLCTALQIALVDLLGNYGAAPSVVLGHSSGEIAAAYAAGALSHECACRVAYFRGLCANELLHSQSSPASMLSVGLSETAIAPYLDEAEAHFDTLDVVVACINSPENVTLSGNSEHIDWLRQRLETANDIFVRKLRVNIAYHSPRMRAVGGKYLKLMGQLESGLAPKQPIVMVSSVTGAIVTPEDLKSGQYWVSNMVEPVRFSTAVGKAVTLKRSALQDSKAIVNDFVEIGPHGALQGPIKDILRSIRAKDVQSWPILIRTAPADDSMLQLIGNLFCKGYPLDLREVNNDSDRVSRLVALPNLPNYPFDHSRVFWHESRLSREGYRLRQYPRLDLLGAPVPDWNPLQARWKNTLRISEQPWIADHKVNGTVLYPATGMLVMALEAAKQLADNHRAIAGYVIKDAIFAQALAVLEAGREVELTLRPVSGTKQMHRSMWNFRLCASDKDGEWQETCHGQVHVHYADAVQDQVERGKETLAQQEGDRKEFCNVQETCSKQTAPEEFYDALDAVGVTYGPTFRKVKDLKSDGHGNALAKLEVYQWSKVDKADFPQEHVIHPITLDSMLHPCLMCLSDGMEKDIPTMVPTRLDRLWIGKDGISYPSLASVEVAVQAIPHSDRKAEMSLIAAAKAPGDTILTVSGLELTAVGYRKNEGDDDSSGALCYETIWRPDLGLLTSEQLTEYCSAARPIRANPTLLYDKLGFMLMACLRDMFPSPSSYLAPPNMPSYLGRWLAWAQCQREAFENDLLPHLKPSNPLWQKIILDPESRHALQDDLRSTPQGAFYIRVAAKVRLILEGKADALEVLFHDDSVTVLYEEINNNVICYEPIAQFFELLSHKNPALNILEIGAGTGSSTDHFLDMLSSENDHFMFSRYDYTDVSPAFFERAAEKYAKHADRMNFVVFDMERDPTQQGVETGTYDLILAASCLHVTENMESTIRNVHKLLKPGGKLVMIEPVQERVRCGFAFGLLPGWWFGKEENRKLRPWLHASEWDELLHRTGFSGVELEVRDYEDERCHEYSIMVSTALHDAPVVAPSPTVSIIVEDAELSKRTAAVVADLTARLREAGSSCELVTLDRLADVASPEQSTWISLCEMDQPIISDLDEKKFYAIKRLLLEARSITWVTRGGGEGCIDPRMRTVDGLARSATTENSLLSLTTIALDAARDGDSFSDVTQIWNIIRSKQSISQGELEPEYVERQGLMQINRVQTTQGKVEVDVQSRKDMKRNFQRAFGAGVPLRLGSFSLLEELHFVEDMDHGKPLAHGELEFKVHASGVNFRDLLAAIGQVDGAIGSECAGVVTRVGAGCGPYQVGDRVSALTPGFRTFARAQVWQATRVPDHITLNDAAAALAVFSTAWYCLVEAARLRKGETVLIHSGAGGTGQSAIQIARHLGAKIYTTVGTAEKKEFLTKTYGIPANHIFSSRNQTFAQGLMRETDGRGVDVVLNSLSGENLVASWECLAPVGRLVEIGKRDIYGRNNLPMWQFRRSCTFTAMDLEVVVKERSAILQEVFETVLTLLGNKTFFLPQPTRTYGVSQVGEALKSFQSGEMYGKAIVEMNEADTVEVLMRPTPSYYFDANRSYVIAGGLGGLGRNFALWMARRGAKNIILLSRSGTRSQPAKQLVEELESSGVRVMASPCDISDKVALSRVLGECAKDFPPIAGCIQGAMVLRDTTLGNMTFEDWQIPCKSKIQGSWNLHTLLPSGMDFFIALSSIACIIGNGGQANYAAGGTYLDELVRFRLANGEKAITLDLGWVDTIGAAMENAGMAPFNMLTSLPSVTVPELHAMLDYCCDPNVSPSGQILVGFRIPGALVAGPNTGNDARFPWLGKKTFSHLVHAAIQDSHADGRHSGGTTQDAVVNYTALFREAATTEDALQVVMLHLRERLSKALLIQPENIDLAKPLHASGVDSLLAVDLRNSLAKNFDADLAVFDLMGTKSVEAAAALVVKKSSLRATTDGA